MYINAYLFSSRLTNLIANETDQLYTATLETRIIHVRTGVSG